MYVSPGAHNHLNTANFTVHSFTLQFLVASLPFNRPDIEDKYIMCRATRCELGEFVYILTHPFKTASTDGRNTHRDHFHGDRLSVPCQ